MFRLTAAFLHCRARLRFEDVEMIHQTIEINQPDAACCASLLDDEALHRRLVAVRFARNCQFGECRS